MTLKLHRGDLSDELDRDYFVARADPGATQTQPARTRRGQRPATHRPEYRVHHCDR
jgi:hypothetical protein